MYVADYRNMTVHSVVYLKLNIIEVMKKTKSLLMMFLVLIIAVSCADDNEFHNLLGSWSDIPSAGTPVLSSSGSKPPPIDGCTEKITINFNENLTGELIWEEIQCDQPKKTTQILTWSIKNDELRINFVPPIENDWDLKSGVNTFLIEGDVLTITNEDGSSVKLNREKPADM